MNDANHANHDTLIDSAIKAAGIASVAISVSPFILNKIGIGQDAFKFYAANCCPVIQKRGPSWSKFQLAPGVYEDTYGVAGALSSAFNKIPIIGGELSRGGITNALASGGLMLLGHYAGNAIEAAQKRKGIQSRVGNWVRNACQLVGITLALPAILPSLGHGLAVLSATAGIDRFDPSKIDSQGPATELMGLLGKVPGECKREGKLIDGTWGGVGVLCCLLPGLLASLPAILTPNKQIEKIK
jgi:hypothetical protein